MKYDKGTLLLLYVYLLVIVCIIIASIIGSGCSSSNLITAKHDSLEVNWDTDANYVRLEFMKSNWVDVFTDKDKGVRKIKYVNGAYRLMAVKDMDTSYSKVIYVK